MATGARPHAHPSGSAADDPDAALNRWAALKLLAPADAATTAAAARAEVDAHSDDPAARREAARVLHACSEAAMASLAARPSGTTALTRRDTTAARARLQAAVRHLDETRTTLRDSYAELYGLILDLPVAYDAARCAGEAAPDNARALWAAVPRDLGVQEGGPSLLCMICTGGSGTPDPHDPAVLAMTQALAAPAPHAALATALAGVSAMREAAVATVTAAAMSGNANPMKHLGGARGRDLKVIESAIGSEFGSKSGSDTQP